MIDRHPTYGDLTHEMMTQDFFVNTDQPITIDHAPSARVSALLGPDGEPLLVFYPRIKLGFDLRPRGQNETA